MNCNSCSGVMLQVYGQTHFHCSSCNSFEFPTELGNSLEAIKPKGKVTPFQCPKCAIDLQVGTLHDQVEVCFCENCRGFVVDSATFGAIATELRDAYTGPEDTPQPIDPTQMDRRESCPACFERMDAHPYYGPGNIVLDTCMYCKLAWLDHGELSRIIRAPGLRNQNRSGNAESSVLRQAFDVQCHTNTNFGMF